MKTAFINGKIIIPDTILSNYVLIINENKIYDLLPDHTFTPTQVEKIVDCKGLYLSPGFIEIHSHGAGGYDFMDGDVESIIKAAQSELHHGVTSLYPTSMTSDNATLFTFFTNYEKALQTKELVPHFMGIHLEGPFFSPVQCGAQSSDLMQIPTKENVKKIWDKGAPFIKRWSIAVELEGALEAGDFLREKGVHLAIGHSNATSGDVKKALQHGYSHVTHLYSGMSSLTRKNGFRILGLVESAYLYDELTIEIIADGLHLPPELLSLIVKLKDNSQICLVTDSMRGAGQKEGKSILGCKQNGLPVIIEDGIAKTMDRKQFAGSVCTADRLVRTMVTKAGVSLNTAVNMLTLNPAHCMHLTKKGSIQIGFDADLLLFDQDIHIKKIYLSGKEI